MNRILILTIVIIGFIPIPHNTSAARTAPLIINHNMTNVDLIPQSAIAKAKANLHIAYEHTSHGSQIITGMDTLRDFPEFGSKFNWGNVAHDDAILDLHDDAMPDGIDLSSGEYEWYDATRAYLNNPANADVNVVMWSWCNIKDHDIAYYLNRMEALIDEYGEDSSRPVPVQFIFMTGHANGEGEGDSSDAQNQLIRQHCIANNRILFDFADIENYDPDGRYYLDKNIDDALHYDSDNDGTQDRNWATEYLTAHPDSQLFRLVNGTSGYSGCGSCAHSPERGETNDARLNCVLKGGAAWWLWARLAGWGEDCQLPQPSDLSAKADSEKQQITLSWNYNATDANGVEFIIQRRVNDHPWNNAFAQVSSDTTTFSDSSLNPGSYRYRILAHQDDGGDGQPCDSIVSNVAEAVISSTDVPAGPTNLVAETNGDDVTLTWQDNSNNEERCVLERKVDNGEFEILATLDPDTTTYTDNGISPEHVYAYRVMASNSAGNSAYSNEAQTSTTGSKDQKKDSDSEKDVSGKSNSSSGGGGSSGCFIDIVNGQ